MNRKTILIGLDGATWDNLMPWIKQGKLPFFKELIETGVHATLQTTIPCLTCPAIPSFFTGLSPVKTKTFGFRKSNGKIISAKDIRGERFWDILGKQGYKSIIANLRITYPPKMKNGVMISNMITPLVNSEFVYPHDQRQYFTGFMEKKPSKWKLTKLEERNRKELQQIALEDDLRRFKKYVNYCKSNKFDFELFYFGSTDIIQHRLWNDQQFILDTYQKIEKVIREYITTKNVNLIIFSDHGFGKSPHIAFHIDNWFIEQDLIKYRRGISKKVLPTYQKIRNKIGGKMFKSLPPIIYNNLYRAYFSFFLSNTKTEITIDPERTNRTVIDIKKSKCYLAQKWGIRLIKKNIENNKLFVTDIIKKLNALEHSGKKVFKEVFRKEDIYPGSEKFDEIPDIIFIPNEEYEVVSGLNSAVFETITPVVEGAHDSFREGIFIANGPDFKKGSKIPKCNICDLAPTVLFMYGCSIPTQMKGTILKSAFDSSSKLSIQKPKYVTTEIGDVIKEIKL